MWSWDQANSQSIDRMLKVISRLEDLPNIGKSIAADLRGLGILSPAELLDHDPLETFDALAVITGHRHDPCILYTLMAVAHFQKTGEPLPWWKFTGQGKELLKSRAKQT